MSCFQSHHCEVFFTCFRHCVNTVNTRLIPVKPARVNNNYNNNNNNINIKLNNILITIVIIIMIIK